jgi:hypothetical protein
VQGRADLLSSNLAKEAEVAAPPGSVRTLSTTFASAAARASGSMLLSSGSSAVSMICTTPWEQREKCVSKGAQPLSQA